MTQLETDIIKFQCGKDYENCTYTQCKNCYVCSKRNNTTLPLAKHLQMLGYGNLQQIKNFCVTMLHTLNDKKNECEAMFIQKSREHDYVSADNWNNDWHKNVDKFAAIQDVINKIDEVMNEQQN